MIEKIKALVVDIDGTLVIKGGQIEPLTRQAVYGLHEKGVLIGLASGRPVDSYMRSYPSLWHLPFDFDVLIGVNGGHLWDRFHGDEVTEFYPLSPETIKAIKDAMAPLGLNAQIYENSQLIAEKWDDMVAASAVRNMQEVVISPFPDRMYRHPNAKIQFRFEVTDTEKVTAFVKNLKLPPHTAFVYTAPGIVEFIDDRVDKGVALIEFARRNDIDINEVMTFGDMQNDMALLRDAGWGVCMLNGCDESKDAADDITEYPVEEDGMGKYLYAHVIGKII